MRIKYLAPIFLGLAVAPSAQAQRIELLPLSGIYRPLQSLPLVADGNDRFGSKLGSGIAVGLAVEARLIGPFGARATVLRVAPDLLVYDEPEPREAPARVNILAADLVVSGPRISLARPYLLLGTGTKRYSFSAASLGGAAAAEYGPNRRSSTGHIGAGVRSDFGRVGASLEMSDYTSTFRSASEPGSEASAASSSARQHDLVYSLGLRIRVF